MPNFIGGHCIEGFRAHKLKLYQIYTPYMQCWHMIKMTSLYNRHEIIAPRREQAFGRIPGRTYSVKKQVINN